MADIPVETIYKAIRHFIEFPGSQICVHAVAAELLSIIEAAGNLVSQELAHAIVFAEDDEALRLLNCHLEEVTHEERQP